ncbi:MULTISPECIES: GntR family transcriptional regulator [unclassified Rhizobium]|jgi:DNA-binding GntR family transcriptional regulator|uniref:GntR family transcriptional regulator n=1 Tax=unclassified Rhizobium TaxID=2613769 RepID=UPI0006454D48|nr:MULTISPECIES: GntR family transcriptional regulator [unclassified Rhizobium]MBN8953398.1 GntR family transcriptional regulator [Rhizobium tropici]OJY74410.1 MAG: GntR family transcriptional regulator [Rhizobium sp. 60-20]RKD67999.1 DNA-binding GntR family transcriptional regulator [Rhizobium sp. WW_1]
MAKKISEATGSRSQAVHRALKRAIIDQALPPGSKLPEDSIGERMGVSRTLVREALLRLSQEGLVELRPNKGAVVARPSLEEGRDLFLTRIALERLVVETLSGNLTQDQINMLSAHIAAEEIAEPQHATSIRLAGEFHALLAQITNNASLIRYVNELVARSSLILALYGRPHSSECAVSEHRDLLDKLIAGHTAEAVALMTHHLDSVTTRAVLLKQEDIKDVLSTYAAAEGLT